MFLREKTKNKFPRTLAFQLAVAYSAVFLVTLLAGFGWVYFSIQRDLHQQLTEDLQRDFHDFAENYREGGLKELNNKFLEEVKDAEESKLFIVMTVSRNTPLVVASEGIDPAIAKKYLVDHFDLDAKHDVQKMNIGSEHLQMLMGKLDAQHFLYIGMSYKNIDEITKLFLNAFYFTFAILIFFGIWIVWKVAARTTQGIRDISRVTESIRVGNFRERVVRKYSTAEVQNLADGFNLMMDKVQNLMDEVKNMSGDLVHDLRRPITRIRILSETFLSRNNKDELEKNFAVDVIHECNQFQNLLTSILDIIELESGVVRITKENLDVSELLEEVRDFFEPLAESEGITISSSAKKNIFVYGNRHLLLRMFGNIVENAIKYTSRNGDVRIDLAQENEAVEVTIRDTGVGIDERQIPFIFDRFYKGESSRTSNGFGLGLSFSQLVAKEHAGKILVESKYGQGSLFKIIFPRV